MSDQTTQPQTDEVMTTDAGNGNPPPKKPQEVVAPVEQTDSEAK